MFEKIADDFGSPLAAGGGGGGAGGAGGAASSGGAGSRSGGRGGAPLVRVVRLDWPHRGGLVGPGGQPLPFVPSTPAPASGAAAFFSDLARPFSGGAAPPGGAAPADGGAGAAAPAGGAAAGGAVGGAGEVVAGLDEVEAALKECVRSSFESRQQAYVDAVSPSPAASALASAVTVCLFASAGPRIQLPAV